MSIEEISLGVGYENQSYFFRQFKKRYGMIPRRYRIEKGQKVCKLLKNSERVGMLFTLQGKRINVKVNGGPKILLRGQEPILLEGSH